ncbi:MAG: pyruvate:ferredoxin (flavodoxin) oxidoreductase [Clostridium sp.]|nr:pyruvate:ferredoxin (flavodoxin) oxidoreductase [Clostridium sp.]
MKQTFDGCTAATYVAYALSDIATIYPITPVASMGETADKWAMSGRLNVFGSPMQVKELESELGAAGATHGALVGGALATTFTSSQGLLLMIPNMFKISGELLPAVFHVGTRSVATQALSIFGDHQDVMACRSTGFAMLASASVQETVDLALVAHLSAIEGRVPVLHFFDGWRTSNQTATVDAIPYSVMSELVDHKAVAEFRARAMSPLHPDLRGSAQNADVYFQNREAANKYYEAFATIVDSAMRKVEKATERIYHLFDYYGPKDAEQVVVAMGSSVNVLREASDRLNKQGMKTGVVAVRLFRPFDASSLVSIIPQSVKCVAVLDRTKEPGSQGEPLLLDVTMALHDADRHIPVIGGRYGLASKEFDPAMAEAVFLNAASPTPKRRFTVGINDDITNLSLEVKPIPVETPPGLHQCIFFGMGSDGTVGATRQAAAILSDVCGLNTQAYFRYSAKKSGGYTISELRYSPNLITKEYSIESADYVGCNKDVYVGRFHVSKNLRPGGIFVLNSSWDDTQLAKVLPARVKRDLARKKASFYNVDAGLIAQQTGLGVRINVIMETVFFRLCCGDKLEEIITALKARVTEEYMHEGGDVVKKNISAIDQTAGAVRKVEIPSEWATAEESPEATSTGVPNPNNEATKEFVDKIARPCMSLEGDELPVSAFTPDGVMPPSTTAWEKRRIAINVPKWNVDKCIECTECSLVCAHAAIRPILTTTDELKNAPEGFSTKPCHYKGLADYHYRIQVYAEDCTGCGSCAVICPGHALDMMPIETQLPLQKQMLEFSQSISEKDELFTPTNIPGTQFQRPLLEFSGACAGCGETPYVKLLTQLFGPRMTIANATGCSSIWGANFPSNAYCTDKNGHGPAWGNSLFEDNAEYGFGIASAYIHRRESLKNAAKALVAENIISAEVKNALNDWLSSFNDPQKSQILGDAMLAALKEAPASANRDKLLAGTDMVGKKSVWVIGGDGWAYDIGFAGLDHILAQDIDINMLVMDTECYSNTGGQTSKATPLGAVMKYASHGKRTIKKDLGRMMMTYGNVYVAQIALGANYIQAINALREAEAYPGPSIVIAYCPCINHGIRTGMSHSIVEEKIAVNSGYWDIYRYDPRLSAAGKNPLTVDMAAPDGKLAVLLDNEDRYADLRIADPAAVDSLRRALAARENTVYDILYEQSKNKNC